FLRPCGTRRLQAHQDRYAWGEGEDRQGEGEGGRCAGGSVSDQYKNEDIDGRH
ncbi:unnamed protein product, partial [Ascophyllum nodosum]